VSIGGQVLDLRGRVLVAGVVPAPRFGREGEVAATARAVAASGADLVDVSLAPRLLAAAARAVSVPVAATVTSLDQAAAAARAGAALALVPPDALADVLAAGGGLPERAADLAGIALAVVVHDPAALPAGAAVAAGAGAPLAFDSTRLTSEDALAAESLAVSDGCRVLRTADVRRSRRVAEVLGAVLSARRTDHVTRAAP
jgi:hypothetical protein